MRPTTRLFVQAAACCGALAASPAHAARPFVTDDARVVDPQGSQIETFVKRNRTFREREYWFLPAHNPFGRVELTLGGMWLDSAPDGHVRTLIAQAKTLIKPLEENGAGYALTVGVTRPHARTPLRHDTNPYVNGIASFAFAGDAIVLHTNLGARRDAFTGATPPTWGVGAELRLHPRLFGIVETFGERGESPTRHLGLRYWVVPNRVQVDSTLGHQRSPEGERRFNTVGLRLLF